MIFKFFFLTSAVTDVIKIQQPKQFSILFPLPDMGQMSFTLPCVMFLQGSSSPSHSFPLQKAHWKASEWCYCESDLEFSLTRSVSHAVDTLEYYLTMPHT